MVLYARNNNIYFAFMENISLPYSLMEIDPEIKRYCDLLDKRRRFYSAQRVSSYKGTAENITDILVKERELLVEMGHLERFISLAVVNTFKELGRI